MKVYQTNEIKNISILGSSGSGKTTLAEAMLYEGGVIKRRGTVEAGNTVCDYQKLCSGVYRRKSLFNIRNGSRAYKHFGALFIDEAYRFFGSRSTECNFRYG